MRYAHKLIFQSRLTKRRFGITSNYSWKFLWGIHLVIIDLIIFGWEIIEGWLSIDNFVSEKMKNSPVNLSRLKTTSNDQKIEPMIYRNNSQDGIRT